MYSTEEWSGIFEGGHIRARMFAPGLGIGEDPATGSACAALAGFLALRSETRDGTLHWTVDQGVENGKTEQAGAGGRAEARPARCDQGRGGIRSGELGDSPPRRERVAIAGLPSVRIST